MKKTDNFCINLRKFHRLTRVQLSRITDIPYKTIGAWERGERTPPPWIPQMLEFFLAGNVGYFRR